MKINSTDVYKQFELTSKILDIFENREEFTQSDLQGAIQAVIMQAIKYGKGV